jgi:hypothetical protein
MQKILLALSGTAAGISITVLCALLGLQSNYFGTLVTINILTGIGGAFGGQAAIARQKTKRYVTHSQLDRAIGAISERYAMNPDRQQILVALQEIKGELQDGS